MKINLTDSVQSPFDHPDEKIYVHLGITMAGAVSGGAYTAGVMDFIFDSLDEWERLKELNRDILRTVINNHDESATWAHAQSLGFDFSLPMHNVTIDAMGGASAGAIATVLSALRVYRSYKGDGQGKFATESMLYDAWVNMSQTTEKAPSTFEEMLETEDVTAEKPLMSLLSSKPLDRTKDRLMDNLANRSDPVSRKYAPDKMNLVLTITSLRPAPVGFKLSPGPHNEESLYHEMKLHRGLARYQISSDPDLPAGPPKIEVNGNNIEINSQNHNHLGPLFDIALASGAFPVGLPPRSIDNLPMPYVTKQLNRMYHLREGSKLFHHLRVFLPTDEDNFNMYAVDGGVMNNDPFAEVNRVLSHKVHQKNKANPEQLHLTANIFIDPFPDFHKPVKYAGPSTILSAAKQLISALLSQTRMKARDILEEFVSSSYYGMVYPSYRSDEEKDEDVNMHPLASEGLGGFSGFLDRSIRQFDYELGKRNARSFLRHYFYITSDTQEPTRQKWMSEKQFTQEKQLTEKRNRILTDWFELHNSIPGRAKRYDPRRDNASLPVIPDPKMTTTQTTSKTLKREKINLDLRNIHSKQLQKLKKPLRARVRRIIHTILLQTKIKDKLLTILIGLMVLILLFVLIGINLWQTFIVIAILTLLILTIIYIYLPNHLTKRVISIIKSELSERGQFIQNKRNGKL